MLGYVIKGSFLQTQRIPEAQGQVEEPSVPQSEGGA